MNENLERSLVDICEKRRKETNALRVNKYINKFNEDFIGWLNDIYNDGFLKGAENAVSKQQWVNCKKDNFPDMYSDWKIVTIQDDNGDRPLVYTTVGWYLDDGRWIVDNEVRQDVIAWMNLPEPWKPEKKRD